MKTTMTCFAKQQIRETTIYIYKDFGKKSKDNFISKLKQTRLLLETNPCLGSIEPLLSGLPSEYRSIVVGHLNKTVYRILDNCIEICDFWDVRRDPNSLTDNLSDTIDTGN